MGLLKSRNYIASLKQQARILGVEAAVTFADFASSPRFALEGAFATLNLSRSASFSRTVLKASACGLPVIATRCGGPEEIIDDGRTGLMVPINDARACADAMRVLCQDPELAARMGAAGRERVRSFSRRVCFFFIAWRRPGNAGCLSIGSVLRPPKHSTPTRSGREVFQMFHLRIITNPPWHINAIGGRSPHQRRLAL